MIGLWLLWMGCGGEATPEVRPDPLERVTWAAGVSATEQVLVTLPAEVEPLPDAVTVLGPRVPSRIVRWQVQPGDEVEAGHALALLESPSLQGLQAAVSSQRRVRDAQQARLSAGVGTVGDVAQADAALASASATLDAARSTLRKEGAGAVWTSPSHGIIAALGCDQGAEAGPSDGCLTLVEPGRVAVLTRVPERHLARLEGVRGRWTGTDGREAELALIGREPTADRATRTVGLRFAPAGEGLVPGTSGRVDLVVPVRGGLEVPASAVTQMEGRSVVFRRGEGDADAVPVEILGRGTAGTLIVGGLAADEPIAVRGVFLLKSLALLEEGHEH